MATLLMTKMFLLGSFGTIDYSFYSDRWDQWNEGRKGKRRGEREISHPATALNCTTFVQGALGLYGSREDKSDLYGFVEMDGEKEEDKKKTRN